MDRDGVLTISGERKVQVSLIRLFIKPCIDTDSFDQEGEVLECSILYVELRSCNSSTCSQMQE